VISYKTNTLNTFEKGPIRRSLFSNGAVTLFHQFKGMKSSAVCLYFLAGSINETEKEYGLAHVIEHMLFKEGGKTEIVKYLEFRGAQINAYTYKEYMCFEMDCLAKNLSEFLPKFLQLFLNPVFDELELAIEKKVVIQELKEDLDDHETEGFEILFKKNFSPKVGHSIGGSIKNVESFNKKDLTNFYNKFFRPERMILSICSGGSFNSLESILLKNLDSRFNKNLSPIRLGFHNVFCKANHFKSNIKRKMESSIVHFAMDGISLQSEYYYDLVILDELLFEGLSSKFFIELREKHGLIYGLGSSINSFVKDGTYIMVFNTQKKNIPLLKKKVKSIISKYQEELFEAHEVEAIKSRVKDSWEMSFDDLSERLEYISEIELYGTGKYSIKDMDRLVDRVTPERIQFVLNKLMKRSMSELIIGPK